MSGPLAPLPEKEPPVFPLGPGHRRMPAMRPVYVSARLSGMANKLRSGFELVESDACELRAFTGKLRWSWLQAPYRDGALPILRLSRLFDIETHPGRALHVFVVGQGTSAVGLAVDEFVTYIDYIADRRLEGVGLAPLSAGIKNPLPWLAEMMDIKKEQNFFEGRVTEYQKASALTDGVKDDDL